MLLEAQKKKVKRQAFLALSSVLQGISGSRLLVYTRHPRRKSYKAQLFLFLGGVWHFSLFQAMVRSSKAYRTCLEQRSPCSNGRFREEKERAPHSLASWWSCWLSVFEV